ncbi:SHOCT domain-containing protein [Nocardioides bizhenqiangii]|uniref:SHOCT domain-containing protein n=1 Tax=Nocardioides bizhenqiangii TaxID=3095076 RepID=A0ABZ0ZQL9_9ACTN|nr:MULTISPECIES: SHOCT domain-containing protein [unclassified Nocardioides]MDZ5619457.1 SHOCT domain-containing protein [Nocardioides sp. HM23]WQQ26523.1 SHOCT domain-containing protein [Nocardioides sp. HM61]
MSVTDSISTLAITADRWDGDRTDFWPIFPILWFLFIAGIIVAAVLYHRRNRDIGPRRAGEARLAERYAAGEIGEEEYRTRRDVLRESQ